MLYERVADSVAIDGDGEHDLPSGTSQVVPYGDGYLALADGENPTPVQLRLYRLDADYEVVEDLGPVGSVIRASADGLRAAWMEVAPNEAFLVVAEDGEVVQRLPLPEGNIGFPVGFTATGTVYNIEKLDSGGSWTWEVAVGDQRTPVAAFRLRVGRLAGQRPDRGQHPLRQVGEPPARRRGHRVGAPVAGLLLPARGPQPRRLAGHRLPRRGQPDVPAAHRPRRAHRPEGARVRRRWPGHRRRGSRGRTTGTCSRSSSRATVRRSSGSGWTARWSGRPTSRTSTRSAPPGSWPADPWSDPRDDPRQPLHRAARPLVRTWPASRCCSRQP